MAAVATLALAGAIGVASAGIFPTPAQPAGTSTHPVVTAASQAEVGMDTPGSATQQVVATSALTMGSGDASDLGGWIQLGSTSPAKADGLYYGELRHLQAQGDQLVALGTINEPNEGPGHDVVLTSTDAVTWAPILLPGFDPTLADLAVTSDGFVVVGADTVDGKSHARVWTSADSIEWQSAEAPSVRMLDRIVSADLTEWHELGLPKGFARQGRLQRLPGLRAR